eukprot:Gb_29622 [translate_table: standard]
MEDMEVPLCSGEAAIEYGTSKNNSKSNCWDDDGRFQRTGTLWTAAAHIITAVIGAGVLSLAWSVAQLGWIAGPAAIIVFAVITYYTSCLLADCYRSPDPITGNRNYMYKDAVRVNLGKRQVWLCGLVQYVSLYGTGIAYTITASISMRLAATTKKDRPLHSNVELSSNVKILLRRVRCSGSDSAYAEQSDNQTVSTKMDMTFHVTSLIAAIMSFSYSTIGLGLGISKVVEHGRIYGTLDGISITRTITKSQKVWRAFQALGDIAFAYPYSMILIEIQDTLKSPPAENKTMKKASLLAINTTTVFYMLCGCFGYAAFGDNAPGNLLTGFGFYEPYWLIDFANACIAIHLVGAYQVFCQPLFAFIEHWFSHKWPNNGFINNEYGMHIPFFGMCNINLFRLCWRTAFVVSTTGIAMLFPFFNDVLGLLGALNFWPLAVYFPVEMYIVQNKVQSWTLKWILFQTFSFICLLISVATAAGSIEGLVKGE